jgi:adenosine deaminase
MPRQRGHLESCPASNLHTGAAASLALHPIHALWRDGLSLSLHTDNQRMSRLDHSTEAASLSQAGFSGSDLLRMGLDAAAASFLSKAARRAAFDALQVGAQHEGLAPTLR